LTKIVDQRGLPDAYLLRHAGLVLPPIVVIALYFSIVVVLGILVSWEFKRLIKQRRPKFPTDL
jgi:hypothetical protein